MKTSAIVGVDGRLWRATIRVYGTPLSACGQRLRTMSHGAAVQGHGSKSRIKARLSGGSRQQSVRPRKATRQHHLTGVQSLPGAVEVGREPRHRSERRAERGLSDAPVDAHAIDFQPHRYPSKVAHFA
jgi:hypothetical protein